MFTLLSEYTAQGDVTQGGWCWRRKQGSNQGLPEYPRGESEAPHVVTVRWKVQSDGRRYGGVVL